MIQHYRTLFWALFTLAAFVLGTRTGESSQEVAEWRSSAGLAVRAGKPYRDSLSKLQRREDMLVRMVRATRSHVESVLVQVPRDSIPESVLLVLAQQTQALDACEEAITTCQLRAAMAGARADSLEALLSKGLRVTKCKILIAPCPSRGLAFVGGALGGLLVSGVLK